jgi:hypothetical protein
MRTLQDRTILGPIAFLGPDFTAMEWAERLQVTLDDVLLAFDILNLQPKREDPYPVTFFRKEDQSRELLELIHAGHHEAKKMVEMSGMSYQTVMNRLKWMERQGIIQRAGRGPNTRWVCLANLDK